jgi:glycosyltransferase involved in cell wall biosynthesis
MNQRGIPLERMTAVPMGVPTDLIARTKNAPAAEQPPVVLYLGGLHVVRRLELLIDCFAEVAVRRKDVKFRVVGEGPDPADRTRLERRAAEHGIADRVDFTGQLPMELAQQQVALASVCLSPIVATPTLRVASPTKFIEYLAWSKPAVGNDHPEQSMIAEQSKGAICVGWSAKEFADAVVWCLDNPQEAAAMASRGHEWVKRHRTYETIGNEVYQRMTAIVAARRSRTT